MAAGPVPSVQLLVEHDGAFSNYLGSARGDIDDRIRLALHGRAMPHEVEGHIMRGKRLRGTLTLLVHDALDGNDRSAALDLAAAVEVAHAVCLIIDDMLDGDEERRGKAAVHVDLGAMMAVLEAVDLLSLPYALAARHGRNAVESLSRVHHMVVSGAKRELAEAEASWDHYHALISQKTGELFALSAAYGAMAADAAPDAIEAARTYGMRCGTVLQVIDDILDMDNVNEPRSSSGPMLGRLLRAGDDHDAISRSERLADDCIGEARKSAAMLASFAPGAVPELRSCLVGAPAEMAHMMVRYG